MNTRTNRNLNDYGTPRRQASAFRRGRRTGRKRSRNATASLAVVAACAWLLAGVAPAHAGVFDVTDYGAVGDDSTDNTAAFTSCLNAIVAAGGGRMYLPDGI